MAAVPSSSTAFGSGLVAAARKDHTFVGPVPVFDGDMPAVVETILASVDRGVGLRVATANLDFIARARRDEQLRADLERSSLVVADGAPVAWLARAAGARGVRRVAGVDLVRELCRQGASRQIRIAFYGSSEDLTAAAADYLEHAFPGANVVARVSPPFRELSIGEHQAHLEPVFAAEPEVVLVALGCPKQERVIAAYSAQLPKATWIGVGGTFDFFAGKRMRAPGALQRLGLEWAVRLAQDPRRLWRRYLVDDLSTLFAVAPGCIRDGYRL